jgi:hypothetical protein
MSQADEIRELKRRVEQLETTKQSWNEYRELVLNELNRVQTWLEQLSAKQNTHDTALVKEIGELKALVEKRIATFRADQSGKFNAKVDDTKVTALEKTLTDKLTAVENKTNANTTEVAKLTVKAGVWGAAAGLIPAVAAFIYWLLKA